MPTVLIVPEAMRDVPARYVNILRDAGFDIRYPRDPVFARGYNDEAATIAELRPVQAVIAGGGEQYSAAVLASVPELRVIARCGVGYDRVDVAAATARGIPVTITPNSTHDAVAELTLALLFAVTKSIVPHDRQIRAGGWPRVLLIPLRGRTLGILGLGRIGRSVAQRALPLGLKVIACESAPNLEFVRAHQIEIVSFDDLLARSDFLSVHCPLNSETRGLFNRATFGRMKRGAIFINTSRGKVVVEADLLEALRSGHLRGAALDVFEQEPPAPDNPLFHLPNVVCSPHLAGTDELSLENMGCEAATCIVKLFRGEWPAGAVVNQELASGWGKGTERTYGAVKQ
jgi:phosphoglycerate dehydrogenase-like enzyme